MENDRIISIKKGNDIAHFGRESLSLLYAFVQRPLGTKPNCVVKTRRESYFILNIKRGSQIDTASPNCLEYDRAVPHATRGRDGRQEGRERSYYDLHCYLNDAFLHPLPLV